MERGEEEGAHGQVQNQSVNTFSQFLLEDFDSSVTSLLSELYGHLCGGGVLELEGYKSKILQVLEPGKSLKKPVDLTYRFEEFGF